MFDIRKSNYYKFAALIGRIETAAGEKAADAFQSVMADPNVALVGDSSAGVDGAFLWHETAHGTDFWCDVHYKVCKYERKYPDVPEPITLRSVGRDA